MNAGVEIGIADAPALERDGLVVVEGLLDPRLAGILHTLLVLRHWRGEYRRDDQVPEAGSHWGDCTLDALLLGLRADIERCSGCALLPTYAYARLYLRGQALARHRDRDACEVAATIHLGARGAVPPIRFAPPGRAECAVRQRPGDAVVYLGDRVEHWREPFEGEYFAQLFLNYVRADGERLARLFDGRDDAFPPMLHPAPRERAA